MHTVRNLGGNTRIRVPCLDRGHFDWASENGTLKICLIGVVSAFLIHYSFYPSDSSICLPRIWVYKAANNELVRTNTPVMGPIIQIDTKPSRQWHKLHYSQSVPKNLAA